MIEKFGIGVDISSIEKFAKKPYEKNKSFYKKIFSNKEIKYCIKFKNSYEKFAGKFALKEATIKSVNKKIHFSEIETFHINSKPKIKMIAILSLSRVPMFTTWKSNLKHHLK